MTDGVSATALLNVWHFSLGTLRYTPLDMYTDRNGVRRQSAAAQQRGGMSPPLPAPHQKPPMSPYTDGSPHRYEMAQTWNVAPDGGGSMYRAASYSSAPGISGSRQSRPSLDSPYSGSARRSPTQLQYHESDHYTHPPHSASPLVAGGQHFSPPPPLRPSQSMAGVCSASRPSPQRAEGPASRGGHNVFDQDQHTELGTQRYGYTGMHGRPSSTTAVPQAAYRGNQPHPAYQGTFVPASYWQNGNHHQKHAGSGRQVHCAPTSAPRPSSTTAAVSSNRYVRPRIEFYRDCGAIVEERDPHTGHVRAAYRCGALLGTGGFAKVFDFLDCRTGERFACKIIDKAKLSDQSKRAKLAAEIEVHSRMQHPSILKFIRTFEDDHYHFILLERCCRQSLMELSRAKRTFTNEEAQFIMVQLLQAIEYMHSHYVIHRDLKLGNIMVDPAGNMKIGDFGFATTLRTADERKRTMCGTPNYIAPEVLTAQLHSGYSFEADVWSLGVILYTLVVGIPPFETQDLQTTYSRIKRCEYSYPSHCRVSDACRDLIGWMLQRDPAMRPNLVQIRNHSYLRHPEAPRTAPASLVGVDSELVPARENPSPYAEAGRSSSPIHESLTEARSPLAPSHTAAPTEEAPTASRRPNSQDVEFTPPPAYPGPQPTPFYFSATPQRMQPQQRSNIADAQMTPPVARPLYHDSAAAVAPQETPPKTNSGEDTETRDRLRHRISSFLREDDSQRRPASSLGSSDASQTQSLHDTTSTEQNESADDDRIAADVRYVDRMPEVSNAPPAPRIFFSDLVHFSRYGFGYQTWDMRGARGPRTKSCGSYFNDKSKLVRDVKDDAVWYFARVREEPEGAAMASPIVPDDLAPRCFYDQLHHFVGGSCVLDPKSVQCQTLSPFLQTQYVFKKYTIVKFMETHFSGAQATNTRLEESPTVASGFKDFFPEPHEDVFSFEPLPNCGDAGQLTFVKEALVLPMTAALTSSDAPCIRDLSKLPPHKLPLVAVCRFSDLSFQVSITMPCPSPLQFVPQVVGVRSVSALSAWKLDILLYDNQRLAVMYRADDDAFCISVADVVRQKKRGFGGAYVYAATVGYPRSVTAVLIPAVTMSIVVSMLKKVHCPDELITTLTLPDNS